MKEEGASKSSATEAGKESGRTVRTALLMPGLCDRGPRCMKCLINKLTIYLVHCFFLRTPQKVVDPVEYKWIFGARVKNLVLD